MKPEMPGHLSKRTVKQMIHGELLAKSEIKYQSTLTSAATGSTNGTIITITQQVVQGDTNSQRTGNQLSLQGIDVKFSAVIPAALVTCVARIIVFQDTQNVGSNFPANTDILITQNYISFYNISEQYQGKRFKIIDDVSIPMVVGGNNQIISFDRSYGLKRLNKQVTYQGVTNATTSNGRNAVLAYILFSNTASGASPPTYDFNSLVRFTDL